jgi:DNA replication protein DnaC
MKLPLLPPTVRTLTTAESDRLKKTYSSLHNIEGCVTCKGDKKFLWYQDESRSQVAEWECDCVNQWILHRFYLNSGIGLTYQRYSWEDARYVSQQNLEEVIDYLDTSEQFVDMGYGLLLSGTKGTGKSLVAANVGKNLLLRGYGLMHLTFASLIGSLTAGWNDEEDREWFVKRVRNAKVLVIDDIGREHRQRITDKGGVREVPTALSESAIDEVLRHRVASSLPTIITTNLTEEQLRSGYGGNVMSLMAERSKIVEFVGEDFRPRANQRVEKEAKDGIRRPVMLA